MNQEGWRLLLQASVTSLIQKTIFPLLFKMSIEDAKTEGYWEGYQYICAFYAVKLIGKQPHILCSATLIAIDTPTSEVTFQLNSTLLF